MATWGKLCAQRPDLTESGRALLYQHGVGLAFLATTRPDSRPRVHPMCPLFDDDGMFAFIVPSPKQADLRRNGFYAMHSFPCPDDENAFYVTGRAHLVDDSAVRAALSRQFVAERAQFAVPPPSDNDQLFEFDIDSCLLTRTTGHGDPAPQHDVWREG